MLFNDFMLALGALLVGMLSLGGLLFVRSATFRSAILIFGTALAIPLGLGFAECHNPQGEECGLGFAMALPQLIVAAAVGGTIVLVLWLALLSGLEWWLEKYTRPDDPEF